MARLDGERKNPTPWIIAIAVLALLGLGSYFLLQNRGANDADGRGSDISTVNARSNVPPDADSGVTATPTTEADAGSATPDASATTVPGALADPNAAPDASATPGASTDASGTPAASGSQGASDTAPVGDATTAPTTTPSAGADITSATPQTAAQSSDSATSTGGETRKRSKTIVNNKTGVTTTYSKEVRPNGAVSHSMTRKSTTGASTQ